MYIQKTDSEVNYIAQTDADVADIPVAELGATIYVVNGGKLYMSDGVSWVEQ